MFFIIIGLFFKKSNIYYKMGFTCNTCTPDTNLEKKRQEANLSQKYEGGKRQQPRVTQNT